LKKAIFISLGAFALLLLIHDLRHRKGQEAKETPEEIETVPYRYL